ncbi:TerD family protein [Dactylosporangium sp. NPDC051484]|uniref:TerD family protein n=1 Tax=Dactylosporangium sp. NPDC051484 TaxID=3154942 RepID=UPI00344CEBBA
MAIVLVKGQNTALAANDVRVVVEVACPTDLSALLVTNDDKVRSDADFVFYNQPDGPGVSCRQPGAGQSWHVTVSTGAVPADVDKVRIVMSVDGTGLRFGQVTPPVARIFDAAGTELIQYVVSGLTTESIVIAVELYRRAGTWKVRAVGQGYAGGLADLIRDHGVTVDDAPAATSQPVTPPPAVPSQVVAAQVASAQPHHVQAQPASAPYAQAQPTQPQYTRPSPPQRPADQPVGRPGAPVSLTKGQRVSLRKQDGSALTLVRMGLGWDPLRRRSLFGNREVDIDLDASAILFADHQPVDLAFYNQLRSKDGSVLHTGDNRTGDGDGDDESIIVDLARVPAYVTTVIFVVTSYQGHTFQQVQAAFCRLVDETTRAELARYTLSGGALSTGMVMAKVFRDGNTWKMMAIGEPVQGKQPLELIPALGRFL